jgi:4a-hydroxytetrahydrobiopterin dehydratase
VVPEVIEEGVADAVAAGGKIVDDPDAPWFTVIAAHDGDRACLCTC